MTPLRSYRVRLLLLLGCNFGVAQAQQPAPANTTGTVETAALQLMVSSGEAIRQLPSAYMESVTTVTTAGAGGSQPSTLLSRMWKGGPDKLYLVMQTGGASLALVSDGKQTLTYSANLKQYTLAPYNPDLKTAFPPHFSSPDPAISALLSRETTEDLRSTVQSAQIVGTETINGQSAKRIKSRVGELSMDVWLADTTQPLPLAAVANMQAGGVSLNINNITRWVHQQVPDTYFQIQPPAGATKVASIAAVAPAASTAPVRSSSTTGIPTVGSAAPDFSLPMADGRNFRLSSARGQRVVVLDFFATWCGPCRSSMPGVEEAANKFPGQVELYAINLREPVAKVQSFLQKANLKPQVLFDSSGQVAKQYGAGSIPYLVVIDKNGVIRAVQKGLPRSPAPFVEGLIRRAIAAP